MWELSIENLTSNLLIFRYDEFAKTMNKIKITIDGMHCPNVVENVIYGNYKKKVFFLIIYYLPIFIISMLIKKFFFNFLHYLKILSYYLYISLYLLLSKNTKHPSSQIQFVSSCFRKFSFQFTCLNYLYVYILDYRCYISWNYIFFFSCLFKFTWIRN